LGSWHGFCFEEGRGNYFSMNPATSDDGDAGAEEIGDGAGDSEAIDVVAGEDATGFYFGEPGGDVSEDVDVIVASVDEGDGDGSVGEMFGGGGGVGDEGADEVVGFGDFLKMAEGGEWVMVDEGVEGEGIGGVFFEGEGVVGFGGNPFKVVDGDDGEGEVGDLGLAGEVDDGGAAKGADFDESVVGLENFDEVIVKDGEVEESGDGGEGGEEVVESLASGVVFVGVLAFVGGIGGGGAEGGVIVAEGEVAAVDDDVVEVGGAGEMVVREDGEEAGVEEVAGGEVAGAGEDGDAEEGVDAVAIVDGENCWLSGIWEAGEDGDVPMEGRVEIVGNLDEDATGGVGGGEVPGGDGAGVGFFDDDVAEDLEGLGVEVFGVEGEDVFDGVGVFSGVQPFPASGGGLGGASPGGVEEGDFGAVFLEVVEFDGVGAGEFTFDAVDLGADLEAEPTVEFSLGGPRGVFGEGKGDGGAVEGGGGRRRPNGGAGGSRRRLG